MKKFFNIIVISVFCFVFVGGKSEVFAECGTIKYLGTTLGQHCVVSSRTLFEYTACGEDLTGEKCCEEISECTNDPNSKEETDYKFSICKQIPDGSDFTDQRTACLECTGGDETKEENRGIWTAIGCIKRDPQSIMQKLIKVGLGMSGGVALLTFLASGFIFSTSQGDPKAYGKAKEMMTAAIVGLIFIIFSVTMLQFIGYEILKIPGFGGP